MIRQFLLLTLIWESFQDGGEHTQGVFQCRPENVSLSHSGETLLLTWSDESSCSSLQDGFVYELEVFIAQRKVHHDEFWVTADNTGRVHSWNWTSPLSLICASHSVRLRSRYDNRTSPWRQKHIVLETQNLKRDRVFPRDRVFHVGSRATFCCIVPAGQSFDHMYLKGYEGAGVNSSQISDQTYSLTLDLNQPSGNSVDVMCKTNVTSYGACVYVGYPPDDRGLQCETRDLQSVDCSWTVGGRVKSPTRYQLLGRSCASKGRCSQAIQLPAEEKNWTLTAENELGKVELHDAADLTKRVHMFAPDALTASAVNSRNISLTWRWTVEQYKGLNLTCQTHVNQSQRSTTVENVGMGLNAVVLKDLTPHWTYSVRVRCGTAQHFWRWGDWSRHLVFQTRGDVPEALNVWMQVKENHTLVIWKKLLANQSHGEIIDYEVNWTQTREKALQFRKKLPTSTQSVTLSVNPGEEHIVTVTARNRHGSSSPSTIVIPSLRPDRPPSRISGSAGGFNLSWPADPAASCGYIVDWCAASGAGSIDWLRVPPSDTSVRVVSEDFRDGLRYLLSVYACTDGAPVLLQRREGYAKETRIENILFESLRFEERGSDVEVSWDPVPLRKLTAFIHGYNLHYQDQSSSPLTVSTDDPHATSLTVRNLRKSSYSFTVTAVTAVGECGNATIAATLNSQTDNVIWTVFITLGVIFGFLSFAIAVCYKQWTCIKQKVYPPIPKPVFIEKFTSPTHYVMTDRCLHPETDVLDVPELLHHPIELLSDYVSYQDVQTAFVQTLPAFNDNGGHQDAPWLSGVSSAVHPKDFNNPSYNLLWDTDAELDSGLEVQTPTRSPDGYQPQR